MTNGIKSHEKPNQKLLKALHDEACFERSETDVQVPQKTKLSRVERLAMAKAIIKKNGFMTLYDYATHQSRSVASKDLRQIVATPTSGITTRGSHSNKVWIAKNGSA